MRRILTVFLLWMAPLSAHVGSPDVFHEGHAGPYRLLVTVRPPLVIPGAAEVEVLAPAGVTLMRASALPLTGPAADHPPVPEILPASRQDPNMYTGSVWLMQSGSWQVRIRADGDQGSGELTVPVPALATRTAGMDLLLGAVLTVFLLLLVAGVVGIAAAAAREAHVPPGEAPSPGQRRTSRHVAAGAAVAVAGVLFLGNQWWSAEAGNYDRYIFRPLEMTAQLQDGMLRLELRDPGWLASRRVDDLLPDHGHLMHLYVIREPEMDRVFHLHPEPELPGVFVHRLPEMPAGDYRLYADIVHQNGLAETPVATLRLSESVSGVELKGDDAAGSGPSVGQAAGAAHLFPDGARMVWLNHPGSKSLAVGKPGVFRFRLDNPVGEPAQDMELYMGMVGHAAFVREDGSVFAHVHPSGSVPMAALQVAAKDAAMDHSLHRGDGVPAEAGFPYALPRAGRYRIFVQMKQAGRIRTAMFDCTAE